MNLQSIAIAGRLTRPNDLRYTPTGTAVLENSVAVNKRWKDRETGEQKESVTFFEIRAWGRNAENLSNYTTKGSSIYMELEMKNESWEDKASGQRRSACRFQVLNFQFLDSKEEAMRKAEQTQQPQPQPQPNYERSQAGFADGPGHSEPVFDEEDDIPF